MVGSKASSFFETGSSLSTTSRALPRPLAPTKLTLSVPSQRRGYGLVSSNFRSLASSGPDKSSSSGPDIQSALENFDSDKLISDVKSKWEKVEDKTSVIIYAVGAVLVLFVGSSVVSAFDSLPFLPKLFQLVGLVYTSWFIYRYLLFKSSRQELIEDVNELKKKISGGQ